MDNDALIIEVLQELFEKYLTEGVSQVNLNDFIVNRGGDPTAIGNQMNKLVYYVSIKEGAFQPL